MKTKKFAAVAAVLIMFASMAVAMPLSAGAETTYSTTKADGTKNTTTLDKYLVMNESANVPNSTFTFTVAPGAAINADKDNGKLAVLAGVGTPSLVFNGSTKTDGNIDLTFSTSDTTIAEADKETDTPVFTTTSDTSDEKYVKKTLTLDFSDVAFTEPGVYRYIITETGNNQGVTNGYVSSNSTETVRTLDVYVEDAGSTSDGKPQLKITGYVMYNGTQTAAPKASATNASATPNGAEVEGATKNSSITNVYSSQDLTLGKIVTGNQGSKDKYFKYTVEIGNITAKNAKMTVDVTKADTAVPNSPNAATLTDYANKTNPAELVADAIKTIAADGYKVEAVDNDNDGTIDSYKITAEYYLQHGQYITIQGLPKDATYSVTEDSEDYTSTNGITAALSTLNWNGTEGNDALSDEVSGTIASADIHTGYTNNRSGVIPTGILTTVGSSAGIVILGIVGVAAGAVYVRKKKSEEE